eukprot:TRINITY_DN1606_c0_g1_i10.p1 TRINITY_DN1606_c0_g1~~TRINITY_DN1606_c0_g1_i10.p1  ORF type:complete len:510 (+),score=103.31 TRINITY_DN1606_c0_g1_i10:191-1720(+)
MQPFPSFAHEDPQRNTRVNELPQLQRYSSAPVFRDMSTPFGDHASLSRNVSQFASEPVFRSLDPTASGVSLDRSHEPSHFVGHKDLYSSFTLDRPSFLSEPAPFSLAKPSFVFDRSSLNLNNDFPGMSLENLSMPPSFTSAKSLDTFSTFSLDRPSFAYDSSPFALTKPSFPAGPSASKDWGLDSQWEEINHNYTENNQQSSYAVQGASIAGQFSEAVMPPAFPSGPWVLEPTHFETYQPPHLLMNSLVEFLSANQIEFTASTEKYSLRCNAYLQNFTVCFCVRVFTLDQSPRYVVEFQRRSGDGLCFHEAYHQCLSHLQKQNFVQSAVEECNSSFSPPPLPDIEIPTQFLEEALRNLIAMSSSEYSDVQYEGIRSLAELSASVENQELIVREGLNVVIECLRSPADDVHRCAATTIANLAQFSLEYSRQVVSSGCLDTLYHLIHTSSVHHVVRESARALAGILSLGALSPQDEHLKRATALLLCHPDSSVRQYGTSFHAVATGQGAVF